MLHLHLNYIYRALVVWCGLTFEAHITYHCKILFYHLRNIAKVHPTLTLSDAEKLVHSFDPSRLDYCNMLLIGIPRKSLQRLQCIQNNAARILMKVKIWTCYTHSSFTSLNFPSYQGIHGNSSLPPPRERTAYPINLKRDISALWTPITPSATGLNSVPWVIGPPVWLPIVYRPPKDHLKAPQTIVNF